MIGAWDETHKRETMMTAELQAKINEFLKVADAITAEYWTAQSFTFAPAPIHRTTALSANAKWARVVSYEGGQSRGVYCFIALQDFSTKALGAVTAGSIHKPASYDAPAKHARGNILTQTPDEYRKALGPHGPNYLR